MFANNGGGRIGRITPGGLLTEFSAGISDGAAPHNITAGSDGNLWYTENGSTRIGWLHFPPDRIFANVFEPTAASH